MDEGAGSISSFCPLLTHCVGGRGEGEDELFLGQVYHYIKDEEDPWDEGAGSGSLFCPPRTHCVGGRGHGEDEEAPTPPR